MIVLVMMKVVVTPKGLHPFEGGIPGVDRIVHSSIEQIAQHEARKEQKDRIAQRETEQKEKGSGHDDARNGRHEQTLFIARKMVVVAMHHINELAGAIAFGRPVEDEPMHQIFEKAPE